MRRRVVWGLGLALAVGGVAGLGWAPAVKADKDENEEARRLEREADKLRAEAERLAEQARSLKGAADASEHDWKREVRRAAREAARGAREARDAERQIRKVEVLRLAGGDGGYLGLQLESLDRAAAAKAGLADTRAVRVEEVVDDSPAAKAGFKADDLITKFDGENVRSAMHLRRLVRESAPGSQVDVEVLRGGAPQRLRVEVGRQERRWAGLPELDMDLDGLAPEPPDAPAAPRAPRLHLFGKDKLVAPHFDFSVAVRPRRLGLSFQEVSGQLARYFGLEAGRGLLVTEVDESGPAGRAGIQAGDVLLSLEGEALKDSGDLHAALDDTRAGQEVSVRAWRHGKPLDLRVTLGGGQAHDERD